MFSTENKYKITLEVVIKPASENRGDNVPALKNNVQIPEIIQEKLKNCVSSEEKQFQTGSSSDKSLNLEDLTSSTVMKQNLLSPSSITDGLGIMPPSHVLTFNERLAIDEKNNKKYNISSFAVKKSHKRRRSSEESNLSTDYSVLSENFSQDNGDIVGKFIKQKKVNIFESQKQEGNDIEEDARKLEIHHSNLDKQNEIRNIPETSVSLPKKSKEKHKNVNKNTKQATDQSLEEAIEKLTVESEGRDNSVSNLHKQGTSDDSFSSKKCKKNLKVSKEFSTPESQQKPKGTSTPIEDFSEEIQKTDNFDIQKTPKKKKFEIIDGDQNANNMCVDKAKDCIFEKSLDFAEERKKHNSKQANNDKETFHDTNIQTSEEAIVKQLVESRGHDNSVSNIHKLETSDNSLSSKKSKKNFNISQDFSKPDSNQKSISSQNSNRADISEIKNKSGIMDGDHSPNNNSFNSIIGQVDDRIFEKSFSSTKKLKKHKSHQAYKEKETSQYTTEYRKSRSVESNDLDTLLTIEKLHHSVDFSEEIKHELSSPDSKTKARIAPAPCKTSPIFTTSSKEDIFHILQTKRERKSVSDEGVSRCTSFERFVSTNKRKTHKCKVSEEYDEGKISQKSSFDSDYLLSQREHQQLADLEELPYSPIIGQRLREKPKSLENNEMKQKNQNSKGKLSLGDVSFNKERLSEEKQNGDENDTLLIKSKKEQNSANNDDQSINIISQPKQKKSFEKLHVCNESLNSSNYSILSESQVHKDSVKKSEKIKKKHKKSESEDNKGGFQISQETNSKNKQEVKKARKKNARNVGKNLDKDIYTPSFNISETLSEEDIIEPSQTTKKTKFDEKINGSKELYTNIKSKMKQRDKQDNSSDKETEQRVEINKELSKLGTKKSNASSTGEEDIIEPTQTVEKKMESTHSKKYKKTKNSHSKECHIQRENDLEELLHANQKLKKKHRDSRESTINNQRHDINQKLSLSDTERGDVSTNITEEEDKSHKDTEQNTSELQVENYLEEFSDANRKSKNNRSRTTDSSVTNKTKLGNEIKQELLSPDKERSDDTLQTKMKKEFPNKKTHEGADIEIEKTIKRKYNVKRSGSIKLVPSTLPNKPYKIKRQLSPLRKLKKLFSSTEYERPVIDQRTTRRRKCSVKVASLELDELIDEKSSSKLAPFEENPDKSIDEHLEDVNEKKQLSKEEYRRIMKLDVLVPWEVPPLHQVETKIVGRLNQDQKQIVEDSNLRVKYGKFSREEDYRINKNWRRFCKMHGLPKDPTPFLAFEDKRRIFSHRQRLNFVRFLAHGLDNRLLSAVYRRFKRMNISKTTKTGRFTEKEDKIIIDYIKTCKSKKPYADLAAILNRTRAAVEKRCTKLAHFEESTCIVTWDCDLIEKFLKNLVDITGVKEVADLEYRIITEEEWKELSERLGILPGKVKGGWAYTIYPRVFSNKTINTMDIKKKLIKHLIKKGMTDWKTVNWLKISYNFKGMTPKLLGKMMRDVVAYHVPPNIRDDLGACLDYIQTEVLPHRALRGKKIGRIKIVDNREEVEDPVETDNSCE